MPILQTFQCGLGLFLPVLVLTQSSLQAFVQLWYITGT